MAYACRMSRLLNAPGKLITDPLARFPNVCEEEEKVPVQRKKVQFMWCVKVQVDRGNPTGTT